METSQRHRGATLPEHIRTPEAAGELRMRLRDAGWRADLAWADVGSRSASGAARAAGGDVRRTIAYLPSLSAIDGGTPRLWKDGDVPAPAAADVREVMLASEGCDDWLSETFEAPPEQVEADEAMTGVAA